MVAANDRHLAHLHFEPMDALMEEAMACDEIREIARAAPGHLATGGRLLLEHGMGQERAIRELLGPGGLEESRNGPIWHGFPRSRAAGK